MNICEECKKCFNYEVCEVGCWGNEEPCEHLALDMQDYYEAVSKNKERYSKTLEDLSK